MSKRRVLSIGLAAVLVFALSGYVFVTNYIRSWARLQISLVEPVEVNIVRGMGLRAVAEELSRAGVISDSLFPGYAIFLLWARFTVPYARFQAGPYRFQGALSPSDISAMLIKGEIYRPVVFEIAVPEGFSIKQVAERLAESRPELALEFKQLAFDVTTARSFNVPADSLEGYLFPATYRFYQEPTAQGLIREMVTQFFTQLPVGYTESIAELGLSLNQAVIIASLIELEASDSQERRMVSEVIASRLKYKMPLGIDAAIIYGIQDYDGNIRFRHLKDQQNLYNLRIHRGLPPTAIGSPSLDSLLAVIEPTNLGYLYYVVNPDNPRMHTFTKSLAEHNRAVQKLVRAKRSPAK